MSAAAAAAADAAPPPAADAAADVADVTARMRELLTSDRE